MISDESDSTNDNICSICYDDMNNGESIKILSCKGKHKFHEKCIDEWLDIQPICPYDREYIDTPRNDRFVRIASIRLILCIVFSFLLFLYFEYLLKCTIINSTCKENIIDTCVYHQINRYCEWAINNNERCIYGKCNNNGLIVRTLSHYDVNIKFVNGESINNKYKLCPTIGNSIYCKQNYNLIWVVYALFLILIIVNIIILLYYIDKLSVYIHN